MDAPDRSADRVGEGRNERQSFRYSRGCHAFGRAPRQHGQNGEHDDLENWLSEAEGSLLASLARGLSSDRHAVPAALREPWSNGQTEGQINKLKAPKRQIYGRASLDLLRARLVPAA